MTQVLFITPYFPPEIGAAQVRISETAKCLVNQGHQVTVLTTVPNYPTGIVPPEYQGHLIQKEVVDGIRVVRVWSYIRPNKGFLRRILAQFSFGFLASFLGWKAIGRPDVIIVESHPLFNSISGRLLAYCKHCPFIFTVSDLWPESAVQLGILRNRVLIKLAEWLEWSTYQRASLIWALTEGIRNRLIERGLSSDHIFLLTNGADTSKFRPLPRTQARAKLSWGNRFTLLYAGNHGLVYGMETVLDAAEQLQTYQDIHIFFVGDGVKKADMIAQVKRRDLKNITFLDPVPHDQMPLLLAAADVCLIPLRKIPLLEGTLPLKMYEAMACACPILLGVNGEARRLAEQEAGAAMYVEPENSNALATAIIHLREHPEVCELLGQRGRAYVERHFDRDQLTAKLDARIEMLLNKKAPISIPVTSISDSITEPPIPVDVVRAESHTY